MMVVAEATMTLWALADDVLLQSLGRLEGDLRDLDHMSPRLTAPPAHRHVRSSSLHCPRGCTRGLGCPLKKLSVCFLGLRHAGVLLEHFDALRLEDHFVQSWLQTH
jgi:hypothetical protein